MLQLYEIGEHSVALDPAEVKNISAKGPAVDQISQIIMKNGDVIFFKASVKDLYNLLFPKT